eukprot:TRINITY_DN4920_c0_g1_i4.p1 TRINITY_DN4920_c0_g1~~TRINITY_DN4920_c0_g1_i4.p1  ORF type:complete len:103 (-),score=17.18 TRINITY_DN4920_c0_g1_i4:110-418(-)
MHGPHHDLGVPRFCPIQHHETMQSSEPFPAASFEQHLPLGFSLFLFALRFFIGNRREQESGDKDDCSRWIDLFPLLWNYWRSICMLLMHGCLGVEHGCNGEQ